MQDAGLAACVCTSPELIYYFTGYEAHTHHAIGAQAVVLPAANDTPSLILRDGDIPQADETLVIGDLRTFRLGAVDLSEQIREALSDFGLINKPIGLDLSGPTMTGSLTLSIRHALGDARIADCWRLLGALRTVLAKEEIGRASCRERV